MSAETISTFEHTARKASLQQPNPDATVLPIGLDFGPTWISVAFSTNSPDVWGPIHTAFPCSQVYKDFYQEALRKKVPSHVEYPDACPSDEGLVPTLERLTELVGCFKEHIEKARFMGVWCADDSSLELKVMGITVPGHWDLFAQTVVYQAARLAGQPLAKLSSVLAIPQAAKLAYGIDDEDGEYLMLIIQYHKSHLHLMLVEGDTCAMQRQAYLPNLGEDMMLEAAAAVGESDSDDVMTEASTPDSAADSDEIPLPKFAIGDAVFIKSESETLTPEPSTSTQSPRDDTPPPADLDTQLNEPFTPELSTSTPSTHNNTPPQDDPDTKPPAHHYPETNLAPIQDALSRFMHLDQPSEDPDLKAALADVKYIVIDGDASMEWKKALRAAVEGVLDHKEGITILANRFCCGVYGAEIKARL